MKPNLNVLAEYRKREAEFLDRAKDMESVTAARDDAKTRYDDLRKVRLDEFMAGFTAISAKLKEMYQVSLVAPAAIDPSRLTLGTALTVGADDHHGRKRRDRADRQHGPVLRGCRAVHHAAQEELAGHRQPLGW